MQRILVADAGLALRSMQLILHTLPAIRDAEKLGGTVTLSVDNYNRGLQLVCEVEARASGELQAALARVRDILGEHARIRADELVEIRFGNANSTTVAHTGTDAPIGKNERPAGLYILLAEMSLLAGGIVVVSRLRRTR